MLFPPQPFNPTDVMQFVYLSDQFREVSRVSSNQWVNINQDQLCIDEISTPNQLCNLHKHVLQASFFVALTTKNMKRMCHLFSKVLNIRCYGRRLPILVLRYMKESKRTERNLLELFRLSLLGNYPHITPDARPIGEVRAAIYRLFERRKGTENTSTFTPLFDAIIKRCSLLLANSLREFVIFSIESHPWFERHVAPLMNLTQFKSIVTHHMNQVRHYFRIFLCNPKSALYHCCYDKNEYALKTVIHDLDVIVSGTHKAILEISYRRPKSNPAWFITTTRKNHPCLTIPTEEDVLAAQWSSQTEEQLAASIEAEMLAYQQEQQQQLLQNSDEESENDEDEDDEVDDDLNPNNRNAGLKSVLREIVLAENPTSIKNSYNNLELWKYVNQEVYRALQAVVQRESPKEPGILIRVLAWLEQFFGVTHEACEWIKQVLAAYDDSSLSIEKLKGKFIQLQKQEPYAYTLIQITADLVKQCERHYSYYELPYHYIQSQLHALTNRFAITKTNNAILQSNLYFVYCEVCNHKYSLIRVFPNKTTKQKTYNQYYRCGFRDVVVDYGTNLMYCKNKKCNVKGKCGEKPLQEIPLLGRCLLKDNRAYMLCGQPNCGLVMEFDPDQCLFNEHGVACADCTLKHKENPKEYEMLAKRYENFQARCFCCDMELTALATTYMLPCNLFLCKKHSKPWLIHEIKTRFPNTPWEKMVLQELKQFIIDIKEEYKRRYQSRNEDRNKRQLQAYKKQQSFKRVRR